MPTMVLMSRIKGGSVVAGGYWRVPLVRRAESRCSVVLFFFAFQCLLAQPQASRHSVFPHYVLADLLPSEQVGYDTLLTFLSETATTVTRHFPYQPLRDLLRVSEW